MLGFVGRATAGGRPRQQRRGEPALQAVDPAFRQYAGQVRRQFGFKALRAAARGHVARSTAAD
eukprot:1922696-Lingulodinium_polyedra.AAC.1